MSLLKEWVRSLVLLVLLAGCMEMLIPINSMKKYVRMTMGLIVVLAMVGPAARLLGQPLAIERAGLFAEPERGLPSLSQIMADAARFRQKSEQLAVSGLKERLAAEARRAAIAVAGVADADADVTLSADGQAPRVSGVTLRLRLGPRHAAVLPVTPVRVGQTGDSGAVRSPEPQEEALVEAVRREVGARLGISADPKLVRVLIHKEARRSE